MSEIGIYVGAALIVCGAILTILGFLLCCVTKGKTYTRHDLDRFLESHAIQSKMSLLKEREKNQFVPGKKIKHAVIAG